MKQKPEQLSEAGFFYTGIEDRVKCFSCGGGLKDWDENYDPWEQHALWLDSCQYLKLMKGVNYIQSVAEKFKTAEEESKDVASTSTSTISSAVQTKSKSTEQNKNEINKNCISNLIRTPSTSSLSSTSSNKKYEEYFDEEYGGNLSTSSECSSSTSVNSNSSKEAKTVCKQPKLNLHHHHISRDLEQSPKPIAISKEKLCKICYAAEYNTAFLPCGHIVVCAKCASSVEKCPMCRKPFTDVMRVHFSS